MASSTTWGNLLMAGAALTLSLGVGEAVMRAFVAMPMRRVLPEVKYAPHQVRRFTLLPNQDAFSYSAQARIDGRAFRQNGEAASTSDAAPTVLALGDSFTFGLGVQDEETWPAQLQQRLVESLGRRVDVVNAGTISYGVFQELDLLRTSGLGTRPRLVVHALYWNDFMNATPPPPGAAPAVDPQGYLEWDQLSQPRGTLRRMGSTVLSSSALLFSIRQAAGALAHSGSSDSSYGRAYDRFLKEGLTAAEWEPLMQFYRELKNLSVAHDFAIMVVLMPVSDVVKMAAPSTHPYGVRAREMLRNLSIPVLDTFELWSGGTAGEDYFLPQGADAHLNAAGYRLVADALIKALRDTPALARLEP